MHGMYSRAEYKGAGHGAGGCTAIAGTHLTCTSKAWNLACIGEIYAATLSVEVSDDGL